MNIATLLTRVAKFDMQDDAKSSGVEGAHGSGWQREEDNVHELMAQDNLNEEV